MNPISPISLLLKLPEVAIVLATYLLVILLVYEAGPFGLFEKFRKRLGIEDAYDEEGEFTGRLVEGGHWAKVFSCHRCAAPYVLALVVLLWFIFPPIVAVLAILGAVVFLADLSNASQ